jgi:hypothetical protein
VETIGLDVEHHQEHRVGDIKPCADVTSLDPNGEIAALESVDVAECATLNM